MNIYIVTDIEGISGIVNREQISYGGSMYEEGRQMLTEEINVCVKACKEAGADKVYVLDGHGGMDVNAKWLDLCPEADGYILGCGYKGPGYAPYIEESDAVILLGFHAMAGTPDAILEHTMDSKSVQNYWINGNRVGESAVAAGIAGDLGKPVIMASGDDKLCAEVKALMPWCVTAEVKKGITCFGGLLLPKEKAHELIRQKTIEAIQNFENAQLLVYDKPIAFRVEKTERGELPSPYEKPYMKIIDGRTFEVTGDTLEEALYRAWQ